MTKLFSLLRQVSGILVAGLMVVLVESNVGIGATNDIVLTVSGSNNQKITLENGSQLYIYDSRDTWVKYQNLPNYLIGTEGTDKINGSAVTLTLSASTICYLIRNDSWSGVDLTGWSAIDRGVSYMTGYDSNFTIYKKILDPGNHTLDVHSAMYACEVQKESTCTAGAKANGTQGTCAEVEIRGGTVQIEAPPTISFGKHTVSGAEQTSEVDTKAPNYFSVEDLKGAAAGYYATLQITDLSAGSKTIAATNLKLKVTNGTVHTLGGPGDANVKVPAKTQDYIEFPSSSPATLLERSADSKGLLGKYGVLPSFQLTIPAYQTLGSYTGTMTYTLIEN